MSGGGAPKKHVCFVCVSSITAVGLSTYYLNQLELPYLASLATTILNIIH